MAPSMLTDVSREAAVQIAFYIVFTYGAKRFKTNVAACMCIRMHTLC